MHPWATKWASKIIKEKICAHVRAVYLISIRDEPNHGVISILDDNIDWVGVGGGALLQTSNQEVLLNHTVASGTLGFLASY